MTGKIAPDEITTPSKWKSMYWHPEVSNHQYICSTGDVFSLTLTRRI